MSQPQVELLSKAPHVHGLYGAIDEIEAVVVVVRSDFKQITDVVGLRAVHHA